uniref:Putative ribonuclease H-like domain-containing protein n=1 Tax=Tanacetum cinerariifolium TaxID=118510 RepID=A0A699GSR9_TANCI|nr:putative ribonuclease H-like domain-containing protein [Tanacetum cinerariifolium]
MGDENPIHTLRDYFKLSHEGYMNTIELLVGNNVLERLPVGSITTWEDLTTRFLSQFFPPGRTAKLYNDILMFQQHHGESLSEAWTRFKDLLQKLPHHSIVCWLQIQIFYDHVSFLLKYKIDHAAAALELMLLKTSRLYAKGLLLLVEDLMLLTRIEQYFLMIDYSLWEVILNGDSPTPTRVVDDKHQLKFNTHKDVKSLMEAIEKSTNESVSAVTSVSAASTKVPVSALPNVDNLSDVVIYSFFARANRTTSIGFDMSKVKCYNCHRRGHFARECRYDWSFQADEEPTNYALMAFTSSSSTSSLGSDSLEYVEARLVVYQQNENMFEENIKLLKLDVMLRDNALVEIRKKFEKAKQERDELKLKLEKFQTSLKNLMFDCDELISSESDVSMPTSPVHDRYQSGEGYHAVPPPYTVTFMPFKPDLVFHDALTVSETVPTILKVKPSSTKPNKDLTYVKPIEHPTLAENLRKDILKSKDHTHRWNRKACFVCKSLNHLIKDSDYYEKKMVQNPIRNHAMRGNHQHYARMTHSHANRHVVPTIVLTRSRLVPLTTARRVTTAHALKDKGVIDNGCSRHMTRNISYLSNFEEINGGYVAFGGNKKYGKITSKGKIRTCKLDFDDVYFVKELKFNLFSVSQMCDKKNNVLFIDTECIILSSDFNLPNENHVLLRVPIENNMYNVDLKNIVPSRDFTCLSANATLDESNLWHKMLDHINFEIMNKLVKGNLVRGLPSKVFENNYTCVSCKKGKQHRASFKSKPVSSVSQPLQRVLVTKPHNKTPYELLLGRTPSIGFMRPFGCPVTILDTLDLLGKFNGKADEGFLVGYSISSKAFRVFNSRTIIFQETLHINFLENQPNVAGSGPTWLFDIDTLTQSMTYQPFVVGKQPNSSVGIQENLIVDPQNTYTFAAFEVKDPEFRVHVSPSSTDKTKKHDEKTKKEAKGNSPIDLSTGLLLLGQIQLTALTILIMLVLSNNTVSSTFEIGEKYSFVDLSQYPDDPNMPTLEDITYSDDEEDVGAKADFSNLETSITVSRIPTTRVHKDHPVTQIIGDLSLAPQTRSMTRMVDQRRLTQINDEDFYTCMFACFLSQEEPKRVHQAIKDPSWIEAMQEELFQLKMQKEKGIDYEEVFALVARIETIRLFLAYASFMGFMVYKVVKALYGLYQAPRAWYETLANYLLENGFQSEKIDQTLFIKKQKASTPIDTEKPLLKDPDGQDVDVHTYSNEALAIPGQTTTGKENSNPFMADSLPKTILITFLHGTCAILTKKVANLEQDKIAQAIEIIKLKQRVKRLEKKRQFKSSRLKRLRKGVGIAELDANEDVTLEAVDAEVAMDADVQGRLPESQANVYHLDLEHAEKVLSMQDIDEAKPAEVKEVIEVATLAKLMTEVVTTAATTITATQVPKASAPRKSWGVVIEDPEETATASNDVVDQVKWKEKERRDGDKRRGKQEKNDSLKKREAKKQRIDEEEEELKGHLQIVVNNDDDVFTEATPLALKVPVVDYQIYHESNQPFYKIIRADGTHKSIEVKRPTKKEVTPDNTKRPTKKEAKMPVKEAVTGNGAEDGIENKSIKTPENEEAVEAHGSQPIAYYLKHKINEKMPKGINTLVDQGSDVNIMPYTTYMKLTNERHVETDIRLSLASHSYIFPLGIVEDVLVEVVEHIYPINFVILDIKENEKRPFILGTSFLTTAKATIKFDKGTITLRSGKSKASLGMGRKDKASPRIGDEVQPIEEQKF